MILLCDYINDTDRLNTKNTFKSTVQYLHKPLKGQRIKKSVLVSLKLKHYNLKERLLQLYYSTVHRVNFPPVHVEFSEL